MVKKVKIRPYHSGDEEKILSLFSQNFPNRRFRNKEWWDWRYMNNPVGEAIIYVAETDDQIVGHLAYIPLRMKLFDREVIGGVIGDSMVSYDYRKQGVRIKLREAIFNEAKRRKWLLAIGFPNKMAYAGAIKYGGYFDACKVERFAKVLQLHRISPLIRNKTTRMLTHKFLVLLNPIYSNLFFNFDKCPSEYEIFEVKEDQIGENFDFFWAKISSRLKIAFVRDAAYLKWRYIDNPSIQYTILSAQKDEQIFGYVVLKNYTKEKVNVGYVLDFMVQTGDYGIAQILLDRVQAFLDEKNITYISVGIKNDLGIKSLLIKNGFLPFKKQNVIVKVFSDSICLNRVTNQNNWFLSDGDDDNT